MARALHFLETAPGKDIDPELRRACEHFFRRFGFSFGNDSQFSGQQQLAVTYCVFLVEDRSGTRYAAQRWQRILAFREYVRFIAAAWFHEPVLASFQEVPEEIQRRIANWAVQELTPHSESDDVSFLDPSCWSALGLAPEDRKQDALILGVLVKFMRVQERALHCPVESYLSQPHGRPRLDPGDLEHAE